MAQLRITTDDDREVVTLPMTAIESIADLHALPVGRRVLVATPKTVVVCTRFSDNEPAGLDWRPDATDMGYTAHEIFEVGVPVYLLPIVEPDREEAEEDEDGTHP